MSKFTAEYRVDNRTFSLDIEAEGWQEAEFKLEALRDNGYFVEKDVIEYQLDSLSIERVAGISRPKKKHAGTWL